MLIVGIAITIIAIKTLIKGNYIRKNGLSAEGIVYDLTHNSTISVNLQLPIIRFVTHDQHWVTKEAKIGLPYGMYKRGQKIKVIYDKDEPTEFVIISTSSILIPYILLVAGCVLLAFSLINIIF